MPFYGERRPPQVVVAGKPLRAIRTLQFSPSGNAAGRVRAVGLGCSAGDFAASGRRDRADPARRLLLLPQGAFARRAGAAAMLVVNDGPQPTPGSLFRFGPGIPVVGIGRDAGAGLAGHRAAVDVSDAGQRRTTNVIGEIGPADAARVVMAGAIATPSRPGRA